MNIIPNTTSGTTTVTNVNPFASAPSATAPAPAAPAALAAPSDDAVYEAALEQNAGKVTFLKTLGGRTHGDAAEGFTLGYATVQQIHEVPALGKDKQQKLDAAGNPLFKKKKGAILVPVYSPIDFAEQAQNMLGDVGAGYLMNLLKKAAGSKTLKTEFAVREGQAVNIIDIMSNFFGLSSFDELATAISPWAPRLNMSESLKTALSACGVGIEDSPEQAMFINDKLPELFVAMQTKLKVAKSKIPAQSKALAFLCKFAETSAMKGAKPQLDVYQATVKSIKDLQKLATTKLRTLQYKQESMEITDAKEIHAMETLPHQIAALEHLVCVSAKLEVALTKFAVEQAAKNAKSGKVKASDTGVSDEDLLDMMM